MPSRLLSAPGSMPPIDAVVAFDAALIEHYRTPRWKSRERLIDLSIDAFLALTPAFGTATGGHTVDPDKLDAVRSLLRGSVAFRSLPMLMIDSQHRVHGHEGRHRAIALMERGCDTMPVILLSASIRWSEQGNSASIHDYIDPWPTALHADPRAADPAFAIAFPVSREEASMAYRDHQAGNCMSPCVGTSRRSRGMGV